MPGGPRAAASLVECPPTGDWSFPSNHATIAARASAVALLLVRRALVLLTAPLALLMAFSRVFVGVHYPHDVAAGSLLGAVVAVVAVRLGTGAVTRPAGRCGSEAAVARWLSGPGPAAVVPVALRTLPRAPAPSFDLQRSTVPAQTSVSTRPACYAMIVRLLPVAHLQPVQAPARLVAFTVLSTRCSRAAISGLRTGPSPPPGRGCSRSRGLSRPTRSRARSLAGEAAVRYRRPGRGPRRRS